MEKRKAFKFPMSKAERIIGIIYIPIHAVVVPELISILYYTLLRPNGIDPSETYLNLIYYAFSFLFLLIFLFRYLRASFSDLFENLWGSVKTIVLSYVSYYVLVYAVYFALAFFLENQINPNTESTMELTKLNANVMIVVGVLFAPIVEETIFRGALFGTLRKKNRVVAYIVTALLFAFYHLWSYFLMDFDWTLFLYLVQYIPASLILCRSYEKSGSIWVPIVIHAAINLLSISVQLYL